MKWVAFVLVLAGAVGLALVAIVGGETGPEPIASIEQRPVAIATLPCARDLQATSSGFVIDENTVVTVAHAIYESRDFAVRDATGQWHDATIQHMDLERDLAVLHIDRLPADVFPIREGVAGENVRMVDGAASGTQPGEVLRRVRINTEVIGDSSATSRRSGYELTIDISGGDSGAAVVGDDDNLLGLIFAQSTRREASWATSVSEIEAVLNADTVPAWQCERDSDAELVLAPLEESLAPR